MWRPAPDCSFRRLSCKRSMPGKGNRALELYQSRAYGPHHELVAAELEGGWRSVAGIIQQEHLLCPPGGPPPKEHRRRHQDRHLWMSQHVRPGLWHACADAFVELGGWTPLARADGFQECITVVQVARNSTAGSYFAAWKVVFLPGKIPRDLLA